MFPVARLHPKHVVLWAVPLAGLACGGDGSTDVVLPPLTIITATNGAEIDPDGYSISVDGQAVQAIGSNTSLTINLVPVGEHTVELSGIAGNCVVSGPNPQTVSVVSGATATSAFEITCSAGIGSIQVATATTGAGTDPDGFALLLDGTDYGSIAISATSRLTGLAPGSHSIGLTGLSGNCQISGENPRTVPVSAGGTAEVAFAIICAAPGAATGNLVVATVTTGPEQDADGYLISIDGGAGQPIATNASVPLSNLTAILHTVELQGLAPNCGVTGSNPLGVAVEPGETAQVSFAVTCGATVGSLAITIAGLPSGANAAATVSGPNGFSQPVIATRTLTGLAPGTYTISAGSVVSGGTTYTASVSNATVALAVGASPTVTVSYTGPAAPTLNLRIQALYLTQSTQTLTSSVPLVSGRAAFLRVFVIANESSNRAKPTVRVRFRNGSSTTTTRTIRAPGGSTPTTVQDRTLGSSWNLPVEAALIRTGLSIEATVDPNGAIAESNEEDNGSTKAFTVRTVSTARIRFVSVQQGSSSAGNVSNPTQLMALARRMHPLSAVEVDVRPGVFTASQPLQADGTGWDQVLGDLDALRVADPDGGNRVYFGIAGLAYSRDQGVVGLAFPGLPSATTALGWDNSDDAGRVVAHELGHIWGRRHSPCGGPPNVDAAYPYSSGQIGAVGLDLGSTTLKPGSSPDIMSYCFQNPWISDYTYRAVMDFRQANPSAVLAAAPQLSLLVWGRIVNGRPVLEPAFQIVTRPSLPRRPGPYSVTATAADGTQLFNLSFDPVAAEDNPRGSRHFAFAVPLDQARAARLGSLRLEGPTGGAARSPMLAQHRAGSVSQSIVARRQGENVSLQWNAATHPMIIVRDPNSGEILSFARGGSALVRTAKGELDLDVSDGVRSQRVRLAINRS
ncbi:MAG: hypothetical protein QOH59_2252 [Gemmatimonadales bacterium]|nr:hypothetical protein [Gemmatimonadales bacterium]